MQVYVTNSGLGYQQYAYLLKTKAGLLVLDTVRCYDNDSYVIGKLIPNNETMLIELNESKYNIEDSPLYNTFLFQELINKELTLQEIIESIKINQKYYLLEKRNKKTNNVEILYSLDKDYFINILDKEKDNKNREYGFRMFSKVKEGFSFINELTTMNKLELIAWLG